MILKTTRYLVNRLGFDIIPYQEKAEFPIDFTHEDIAIIRAVRPYTMTSIERIQTLITTVRYIVQANIPGAIVECGVWRGGSMMAVAQVLQHLGDSSRQLFLFDTFEGMPPPTSNDRQYSGELASALLKNNPKTVESNTWAYAPLEHVQANMFQTGYPPENMHFIKGKVEDTIPAQAPAQIALLRLDTDWYESTLHELTYLYPCLSQRGVLIIDDYGWWQGAKQAVDEYFFTQSYKPLLHRIDGTARSIVKV